MAFQPGLAGDENFQAFVLQMGDDGVITYDIDPSMRMKRFVSKTMAVVDEALPDVQFVRVPTGGEISYKAVESLAQFGEGTLGVAQYSYDESNRANVDLDFDISSIYSIFDGKKQKRNMLRYVILHELGHAMGLEHPFDTRDGDELIGATGSDTRMAYDFATAVNSRQKLSQFTQDDIDTITGIWNQPETDIAPTVAETGAIKAPEGHYFCRGCGCYHANKEGLLNPRLSDIITS